MPPHRQTHVKTSVGETKQNEFKQANKNMNLKVRESVLQTARSAEGKRKQLKREQEKGRGKHPAVSGKLTMQETCSIERKEFSFSFLQQPRAKWEAWTDAPLGCSFLRLWSCCPVAIL